MERTPQIKHLVRWASGLAVAMVLYALMRGAGLHGFTSRETEGLNTLILLMGSIYAVMYAFVIFVIWGQFAEVESLVARECSSLDDLMRFSRYINADAQHSIRRATLEYCRLVPNAEWEALGKHERDVETERAFGVVLKAVVQAAPVNPLEAEVHKRLIDIAQKAGECRDQRIAKSLTRIPPTLMRLVRSMASALVLLVFVYPFHHAVLGACCFVLVASVLFFADVVMIDTDNPFSGMCNVSAQCFEEVAG